MIRTTMLFLCVLLAAAAFGRYRAEVTVRDVRAQTEQLKREEAQLKNDVKLLRAEIAYLESPDRLRLVADLATDLEPAIGSQLLSANTFLVTISPQSASPNPFLVSPENEVDHAMAVIDLGIIR